MNTVCIEAFVYKSLEGCINGSLYSPISAHISGYISKEYKGNINLKLPDIYAKVKIYIQRYLDNLSQGCLYTLPLYAQGYGYISTSSLDECKPIKRINKTLRIELDKYMDILDKFPPKYITKDINLLWDNHRPFIPEIGDALLIGNVCRDNHEEQNRIIFKILATVKGCNVYNLRGNWLVTLVEYRGEKVMILFNHQWNRIQNYPYRYVLNKPLYREMLTYILSLFKEHPNSIGVSGTYSNELYCTQPHKESYLKHKDCFSSQWETHCLTPFDTPPLAEALIEDISQFISQYSLS